MIYFVLQRCSIDDDYSYGQAPAQVPKPESKVDSDETRKPDVSDHHRDEKINSNGSKAEAPVYLAKRLSCKWSTGVGPRIGCVRDYPSELQSKALEQVNLSPRIAPGFVKYGPIPSPRPSPKIHLSPGIAGLGLPSPRPILATS